MQVVTGGQINNKVFWNSHLFSTYPLDSANQPVIGYDYIQDERNCIVF